MYRLPSGVIRRSLRSGSQTLAYSTGLLRRNPGVGVAQNVRCGSGLLTEFVQVCHSWTLLSWHGWVSVLRTPNSIATVSLFHLLQFNQNLICNTRFTPVIYTFFSPPAGNLIFSIPSHLVAYIPASASISVLPFANFKILRASSQISFL